MSPRLKAVFLISIALPIGCLAALKAAGILEPRVAATTTLEPIAWTYTRDYASHHIPINESLISDYTENGADIQQRLIIWDYASGLVGQRLFIGLETQLSISSGFVERIKVSFLDYGSSRLNLDSLVVENLTSVKSVNARPNTYYYMIRNGYPSEAHFNMELTEWFLSSPESQENHLTITSEITYYNGTTYNEITQPFILSTT
jgi:hypothetical protein